MDFRSWFPKSPKSPLNAKPLEAGRPFPMNLRTMAPNGQTVAVGIVSLHCSHCVDMLPHLVTAVVKRRIPFVLVSSGTPQENANVAAYFGHPFPIVSIAEEDVQGRFGVEQTPYFYFVLGSGIVADGFTADTAEDVIARWLRHGYPHA
ncbi:TlpA family protein disulfide reductase [Cohnella terricola]|uniref:Thioredoxin domain-containing protein n=1 Tax=Cohnella terricola TaxID=1289167 RepID=A0A559J9E6_9BACL|nr:hypothetical protein [Cohnella terricola]TVX96491.1 hypothetical protein FPZ45_21045 [Cohnella terricola]